MLNYIVARKKESIGISNDELKDLNIKADYYDDQRGKEGFIRVMLNKKATTILADNIDDKIESKQRELEYLKDQRKEIATVKKSVIKSGSVSKKEKKKKKKEKKKLKNMPESSKLLIGAIEEYKNKFHGSKKNKFDGVTYKSKNKAGVEKTDEEADEQKRVERDKKIFDKKFEEPITILRQVIIEVDKTIQDIDSLIEETKISRARNKNTMLKDLLMAKSSLFSNKTTNARSIGDRQKIREEIQIRKAKEDGPGENEKNRNIALISRAFPQIIGGFKDSNKNKDSDNDKKKESDKEKKKDKDSDKKRKRYRDDDTDDRLLSRASKLIKDGSIELTAHEAGIHLEGRYRVAVMKSYKTGDWKFIATDNDGKVIKNFETDNPGLLPKKKHTNLRFDDERDACKCLRTDIAYQVISVPNL